METERRKKSERERERVSACQAIAFELNFLLSCRLAIEA